MACIGNVHDEEEILEIQLQEEKNVNLLRRQFNILGRSHAVLMQGSDPKTRKTKKVIDIYKNEKKNVQSDLLIAISPAKKLQDKQVEQQLKQQIKENNNLTQKIKTNKENMKDLEQQIYVTKKMVEKARLKQLTDKQFIERTRKGENALETLENRLYFRIKGYCTLSDNNEKFREEIDHLLKERKVFGKIWNKWLSSLYNGKKIMLDLIEQSTIAYDQREETVGKLNMLRTKAYSDFVVDCEEITRLKRNLENIEKTARFLQIKCQKRNLADLENKTEIREKEVEAKMQQQLSEYGKILFDIQQFTGQENFKSIVRNFAEVESKNYSYLKTILEMNREINEIGEELAILREDIVEKQEFLDLSEIRQQEALKSLEKDLLRETSSANKAEAALNDRSKKLSTIYQRIMNLFTVAKCSNTPFLDLLGKNDEITHFNVFLYLLELEHQIAEKIITATYLQRTGGKKDIRAIKRFRILEPVIAVTEYVDKNPCPLCVEVDMVSDVIDELQIVRTRKEVEEHLEKRLQLPDGSDRLHSVSECNLPKSRQIIQRRLQK